jgi:hypothetical protein
MRRWRLLVLIALLASPVSTDPSAATYTYGPQPGYPFCALPEDPWPYNAAAGPAGGWGIAASSWNPASLVFGSELSAVTSLFSVSGDEEPGLLCFGSRFSSGWGVGLSITWLPSATWGWAWYDCPVEEHEERERQYSTRLAVGKRLNRQWGVGIGFRYSNSAYLETIDHTHCGEDEPFTTDYIRLNSDDLSIDLGFRAEGMLPSLTLISTPRRTHHVEDERWPPGLALAAGLSRVRFGVYHVPEEPFADFDWPASASLGVVYRPIVSREICVALNGTVVHWFSGAPAGESMTGDHLFQFGNWGVGAGVEILEAIELGLAYWSGYARDVKQLSWFAAVGPEAVRLTLTMGPEAMTEWHDRYPADYWDISTPDELEARVTVRFQIPFGAAHRKPEKEPRDLPQGYDWWR